MTIACALVALAAVSAGVETNSQANCDDPGWPRRHLNLPRDYPAPLSPIRVAVIDSGVDYLHPQLRAAIQPWPDGRRVLDLGPVPSLEDDPCDAPDGEPRDCIGHGTHIAGAIAAFPTEESNVRGLAPGTQILAIKVVATNVRKLFARPLADALTHAAGAGARVINLSAQTNSVDDEFHTALAPALARLQAAGILLVVAAGNDGKDLDKNENAVYPACYNHPNIITVLATDSEDRPAQSSNYGPDTVDLGAPGANIHGLDKDGGESCRTGSSMAAAHVTGALALLWSMPEFATLDAAKMKQLMLDQFTRPVSALEDKCHRGRVLDLAALRGRSR